MKTVAEILAGKFQERISLETKDGQRIEGIISEQRVSHSEDTVGRYVYDIRHTDNDWCELATIEPFVRVNWFGCLIVEKPISFPANIDYLNIKDWSYVYE